MPAGLAPMLNNMDNKREIINYKKKYRKSLKQYIAMMQMADIFDLEQSSRELLLAILDENHWKIGNGRGYMSRTGD